MRRLRLALLVSARIEEGRRRKGYGLSRGTQAQTISKATPEPSHSTYEAPADKSNMARYLFGGFERCLYPVQKFQSDPERKLSVILERDALKWFKPVKGQFQLYYKLGHDHHEYQPDFVAETADCIYMLEPKAANNMSDADVLAKRDAAVKWCKQASEYTSSCEGKPWQYVLIPHDAIAQNMTLVGLAKRYGIVE